MPQKGIFKGTEISNSALFLEYKIDADVNVTIHAGTSFWPASMHEPLILLIVLPLTHDQNYRGPWALRQSAEADKLKEKLEAGFRDPSLHGCEKLVDVGHVHAVRVESPLKTIQDGV